MEKLDSDESYKFKKVEGPANRNLFTRNGIYYVRASSPRKPRLQKCLGTDKLQEAKRKRDSELHKYFSTPAENFRNTHLVEDLFPRLIEEKIVLGKRPATIASLENSWNIHLKEFFGGMLLKDVGQAQWTQYIAYKRSQPKGKDRKFFNDRKNMNMFLKWAYERGVIPHCPQLRGPEERARKGVVYTDEQIELLLSRSGKNIKLQILMAFTMGMRIGEILSLEWDQINFEAETIYLPATKTKTKKERVFNISDVCLRILKERKGESKGLAVFPQPGKPDRHQTRLGSRRAWASAKRLSGISKECRFHWLRHTFLTRAFKNPISPALICNYAGISMKEAERTYLHFDADSTRQVSELVRLKKV